MYLHTLSQDCYFFAKILTNSQHSPLGVMHVNLQTLFVLTSSILSHFRVCKHHICLLALFLAAPAALKNAQDLHCGHTRRKCEIFFKKYGFEKNVELSRCHKRQEAW
jgi:hypothetical protein